MKWEDLNLIERSQHYKFNEENFMNSGLFKMTKEDWKRAFVYAFVVGVLAMIGFVFKIGTFWGVDYHTLVDVGGLAFLGAVAGIITPLLTTEQGNFVGAVKIK